MDKTFWRSAKQRKPIRPDRISGHQRRATYQGRRNCYYKKKLKNGKAPDHEQLNAEVCKTDPEPFPMMDGKAKLW